MLTQWGYLFFSSNKKKKSSPNKSITFLGYQDLFTNSENTTKSVNKYKCLNCNKINYVNIVFCNIDCENSFKIKNNEDIKDNN